MSTKSSKRTVANKHILVGHNNKHWWRAFRGYEHRWPWTTLNSENRVFWFLVNSEYFCALRLPHILRLNSFEITAHRPRQPTYENMALDVDFNGLSVDPLRSTSSPYECIKFGYRSKHRKICNWSYYAPQLYRQVLLRRVLAMGILSVRLSVGHEPVVYQAQVR